jgi:hypothetical protein
MHFSAEDKEQLCSAYIRRALKSVSRMTDVESFQPT